jgi:hypothetical protein
MEDATTDEELADAQKAALDLIILAAAILETNPDPAVAEEAKKVADAAEELKQEIIDTGEPLPTTTTVAGTTVAPTTVVPTTAATSTSMPTTTTEGSPSQ